MAKVVEEAVRAGALGFFPHPGLSATGRRGELQCRERSRPPRSWWQSQLLLQPVRGYLATFRKRYADQGARRRRRGTPRASRKWPLIPATYWDWTARLATQR